MNRITDFFFSQVFERPDADAFLLPAIGNWQPKTWGAVADDVCVFASRLLDANVLPGDRVVQISENRYEWIVADLAMQTVGAVHVPLHPQLTISQTGKLLEHCQPSAVFVSGGHQRGKIPNDVRHDYKAVWSFDACPEIAQFDSCQARLSIEELAQLCDDRITPDTLLTILYTSGTSGEPKGVMLSQFNVASNALAKAQTLPLSENDVRLCWLPMSHIFSRTCDLYTAYVSGCVSAISRGREYWFDDLLQVRPTFINGVPYFYEKCYRHLKMLDKLDDPTALRTLLGGRMKLCNCGGAPLADHVLEYFLQQGIDLVTGYGLTEASPVITSGAPGANRPGTVGRAINDVEVQIAADGEVMCRGPNVMVGYFRDQAATAETVCDGWLRTGDLGWMDEDQYLTITGRKKDLIITRGGKNIAPIPIETLLNKHSAISQSCVLGDRHDYLVALIVPRGRAGRDEVRAAIDAQVPSLPAWEQIVDFELLDEAFEIQNEMLTAKRTLRRKNIVLRYQNLIDAMYERNCRTSTRR